jgi:membrane carboxypeptidase/penicillin-binding protein
MPQNVADAVSDVLRGVLEGGFAYKQQLSVPAAGKTGTTNEGRSVWFIGYTPHVATAVMLGGLDDVGRPASLEGVSVGGTPIYDASGSGFAAPIWGDAMRVITAGAPYDNFVYPEGIEGVGVTSANPPGRPHGGGHSHGGGHGHGHGR